MIERLTRHKWKLVIILIFIIGLSFHQLADVNAGNLHFFGIIKQIELGPTGWGQEDSIIITDTAEIKEIVLLLKRSKVDSSSYAYNGFTDYKEENEGERWIYLEIKRSFPGESLSWIIWSPDLEVTYVKPVSAQENNGYKADPKLINLLMEVSKGDLD